MLANCWRNGDVYYVQPALIDGINPITFQAKNSNASHAAYSSFLDVTIRIPPRATSRKRTWNPLKSLPKNIRYPSTGIYARNRPITMNTPNGLLGYSTSGKKSGASRKDIATFVGWYKLVFRTCLYGGYDSPGIQKSHALVKHKEGFKYLQVVLVWYRTKHLVVQLFISKLLNSPQPLTA